MSDNYVVIKNPQAMDRPPTFVCMICGEYDDPDANMVDTRPWICNRCAKKLKELLYGEETE